MEPGVSFIKWPLETIYRTDWKRKEENSNGTSKIVRYRLSEIDTVESIYDPPKYKIYTYDNTPIEINLVITYIIKDVKVAVLNNKDIYSTMQQAIDTCCFNVVSNIKLDDIMDKKIKIIEAIKNKFSENYEQWGIVIIKVALQSIDIPQDISEATINNIKDQRIYKTNLEKQKAKNESNLLEIETQIQQAEKRHEKELKEMQYQKELSQKDIEIKILKAEAECQNKKLLLDIYKNSGLPSVVISEHIKFQALSQMKDIKYLPYQILGMVDQNSKLI